MCVVIEPKEVNQPDRIGGRLRRWGTPLDLREVCRDERDLAGSHEIDQRWAREEGGIQPERTVRDEVVGAHAAQEVTTRGAATNAARGEHARKKGGGSYKGWRVNDNAWQRIAGDTRKAVASTRARPAARPRSTVVIISCSSGRA